MNLLLNEFIKLIKLRNNTIFQLILKLDKICVGGDDRWLFGESLREKCAVKNAAEVEAEFV
jgi:hypothetical protein